MPEKNQLHDLAVIIGGSSGIGYATAVLLAGQGLNLVIVGRNKVKLTKAIKKIKSQNHNIKIFPIICDISNETEVQRMYKQLVKEKSKIKHLVLCAGSSQGKSLLEGSSEGFNEDITNNLTGTYYCLLYAIPLLSKGSSIVTISSIRARGGTPSGLGYATAKTGIISLTQSAAIQLAPQNIRVNCVVPGAVYPTGLSQHWTQDKRKAISNSIPLKRLAKPEDIANAIWFLLSDSASYITGQTLDVNGGEWMG